MVSHTVGGVCPDVVSLVDVRVDDLWLCVVRRAVVFPGTLAQGVCVDLLHLLPVTHGE